MTRLPPARPKVRRAFKATAALVSVLAALTSIVNFALSADDSPRSSDDVAWVAIMPREDTVASINDTVRFTATIADEHGAVITGTRLLWSTDNPAIATVNERGQVTARGAGSTMVTAAVGGRVGRARVVVRPAAAHVTILADGETRLAEDEHRSLGVRVTDARGFVIGDRPVLLQLADTSVAGLDSAGALVGRLPGRTVVFATVDDIRDSSTVVVSARPGTLLRADEDTLRAPAGRPLRQPVSVRVLSRRDRPVGDVLVRFAPADAEGAGRAAPDSARTDASGRASVVWTLGAAPGRQRLTVSADGVERALTVIADAEPLAENTRYVAPAGELVAPAGAPLGQPVVVRVTDTLGRPLVEVPIVWSVDPGMGVVEALGARTDSLGVARARWTLGPRSGRQRLRVHAGRARVVPPLVLTATAGAGAPASVTVISGASQRGRVGAALPARVRLRVRDAAGNPVPGARVRVKAMAGAVADTIALTDSAGMAAVVWTLGPRAGAQELVLRAEGIVRPVPVAAVGRAAAPANLEFIGAPAGAVAGRALPSPVQVLVTDAYGNPVSDAQVSFAPRAGSATPRVRMTDASGRASSRWTLGRDAGTQILVAAVARTEARAELPVDVKPAAKAVSPPPKPSTARKPAPARRKGR